MPKKYAPIGIAAAIFALGAALFLSCEKKDAADTEADNGAVTDLYVLDMQPDGQLPADVTYPSVYIQFSQPVAPLSVLGEPSDTSEYVKINPPLKGVFRWYGTSLLSFDSSEPVIPQREYTVTVSKDIVSSDGTPISGPLRFSFYTEDLTLLSIIPGYDTIQAGGWVDQRNTLPDEARSIALVFSYPVQLGEIKKHLSVIASPEEGEDVSIGFSASQPDKEQPHMIVLSLDDAPPEDSAVTVCLKEGARSEPGARATTKETSREFHTLQRTSLLSVAPTIYTWQQYSNPVELRFSQRLDADMDLGQVAAAIHTEPAMEVSDANIAVSGSRLIIHGLPVDFEQTYSLSVDADVIKDAYGRVYGEAIGPETITVPKARSYASFKDYGFKMLENQFDPKLIFEYQNVLPGSSFSVGALTGSKAGRTPDTVVLDEADIPENTRVFRPVDLTPYLTSRDGRFSGAVEFNASMQYSVDNSRWGGSPATVYTHSNNQVIQVTDLGMTVRYGFNKALVLVTKLSTGEAVPGATVSVSIPQGAYFLDKRIITEKGVPLAEAVTDERGLAVLHFQPETSAAKRRLEGDVMCFRAEKDGDSAVFGTFKNRLWGTAASVQQLDSADKAKMVVFMFTDRGLYKPGERLQIRGIDRDLRLGGYEPYVGAYTLAVRENTWQSETILSHSGTTSLVGGFNASFDLPDSLSPGNYIVQYSRYINGKEVTEELSFMVAYFERLRFETSVSIPDLTYISGDRISADISAAYLGGGSLAGLPWRGGWYREPASFRPQGEQFEGFAFAPVQGYEGRSALSSVRGVLGENGAASASQISGGEKIQGRPYLYRFESSVTDSGGQAISASSSALVHPAQYYIGVSSAKNVVGFPKKKQKIDFDFLLAAASRSSDPSAIVIGDECFPEGRKNRVIKVELLREDWKQVQQVGVNGNLITRYTREMVAEETKEVPLAQKGSVSVTPPQGGAYVVRLSSTDSKGRAVISERSFYVSGSDWSYYYGNSAEEIRLLPDKQLYDVGDTARIILQSPLPSGTYLMTVEREGIFSEELLQLKEPTTVLEIPVTDRYLPVVYVTVSSFSVRSGEPTHDYSSRDMDKPKGYFGATAIHVDPSVREFDITVAQDKSVYRPGDTATFTLTATKAGQPLVGAEISLMAVDRGVIDLINYHVPDPVAYFYNERLFPSCVYGGDSRELLMDPVTYEIRNLYGGDEGGEKINERKNFDPTAVFIPELTTGADGTVSCSFTVPDNLTEYRVTTVGVLGDYFALTEDKMTVNNPVSVRDILPRRLREGDVSDAGVVVSNLSEDAVAVSVNMEILPGSETLAEDAVEDGSAVKNGAASVVGNASKTATVPPGGTTSVFFDIGAERSGVVTVQFTVSSSVINERIIKPLEIDRPILYETVTTVGDVSSGDAEKRGKASVRENIVLPLDTVEGAEASLFVCLDPTRLGTLAEAVSYVFRYPYGCLEQRCSAMIPLVYFGDYIDVFGLDSEVSSPDKLIEKELRNWAGTQKEDGGFPYWANGVYSSLHASLRFAELIAGAKEKGLKIPAEIDIDALVEYIVEERKSSSVQSPYAQAYSLFVAQKLGYAVTDEMIGEILAMPGGGLSEKALCGLLYVRKNNRRQAAAVAREMRSRCRPTTRGVDITDSSSSPWMYFNDVSERNALMLQFFTELDVADDMNRRLLFNLLEIQRAGNGYWRNTASTARVLEAIAVYIKANNLDDLDFTAVASLGDSELLAGDFKGAGAMPVEKTLSVSDMISLGAEAGKETSVTLSKNGVGSLFYVLSLKYPLPVERQSPRDEGLSVFVSVTNLESGATVTDGQLKAGTVYRAKVTVSTTRDRTFVACRAPIPSGAEVLNAAFATTEQFIGTAAENAEDGGVYGGGRFGLSSQEIYDNEVRYFWDVFPKGSQQVEFLFRTVRHGSFTVPSATAECMYEPEIFGRSKGGVFVISE